MAEDLSPEIRTGEIPPKVKTIQGVSTSTAALVGVFSKGPIGVARFIAGAEEFSKIYGGANSKGVSAMAVDKFFKQGGSRMYVTRTAHYSDPATASTVTAVKSLIVMDDRLPNAGVKATGSITVGNNAIDAWIQSFGSIEIINNTFDASDAVVVNGVSFEQAVDWTPGVDTIASALVLKDAINASVDIAIAGVLTAVIDGTNASKIILTAVSFGAAGNALTLAEVDGATDNFTISGATFSGGLDGDVVQAGDSDSLQFADNVLIGVDSSATALNIKDAINGSATNVIASIDAALANQVNITAVAIGLAGNSLALTKVDANDDLLLSGATLLGGLETDAENAMSATADDGEGVHADGRIIRIAAARNGLADHFKLLVMNPDGVTVLDAFDNLNLDPLSASYAETKINGKSQKLIVVSDLVSSNTANDNNLPALGDHVLAGGNDGLVGLNDQDFIGSAASKTGIYSWDLIEDKFSMAAIPERTTIAVQQFGQQYATLKKHFKFFNDFPSGLDPQGAVSFIEDNGLVSEYGSWHWPNLKVQDLDPSNLGNEIIIPCSMAIMGLYARTDSQPGKGVAKTAAGVNDGRIFDIVGFESDANQEKGNRDLLFPSGINPLWSEQGVGTINDGGRLSKLDGLVANINERRVFIFAETSIKLGIRFARHENIDEKLFNSLNASITAFLTRFWRQGGLKGSVASDAFFVNTENGIGTINPPSEAAASRVNVEVGLATKKPGYFITVNFTVDQRKLLEELGA